MKAGQFGSGCIAAAMAFAIVGAIVGPVSTVGMIVMFAAAALSMVVALVTSAVYYNDADVRFMPGGDR